MSTTTIIAAIVAGMSLLVGVARAGWLLSRIDARTGSLCGKVDELQDDFGELTGLVNHHAELLGRHDERIKAFEEG